MDPESARFRNERVTKSGTVCGEVNSKNSLRGYVGFTRYILVGHGANYIEGTGALENWSPTDEQLRNEEETPIRLRTLKHNDANRGLRLDMPSDSERQEMATKQFFETKWAKLCSDVKA